MEDGSLDIGWGLLVGSGDLTVVGVNRQEHAVDTAVGFSVHELVNVTFEVLCLAISVCGRTELFGNYAYAVALAFK